MRIAFFTNILYENDPSLLTCEIIFLLRPLTPKYIS